jgi:hypothetical protein
MTISLRTLLLVALAAALGLIGWLAFVRSDPGSATTPAAVRAGAPAAAPARQTPDVPFGTVRGSEPDTTATLLSLRRTGPKVVTARVQIALDESAHGAWLPELEGSEGTWYTAEGLRLSDEFNGRELFPLVDDDGSCLCSRNIEKIGPGEAIVVSAKFPAPPANVTHASLLVPGFSSFDGVPLAARI